MEAFLAYWLSWYILLNEAEDELNQYFFLLINQIAKGVKFALAPLFLRSLYAMLYGWQYHPCSGKIQLSHACGIELPLDICIRQVSFNCPKINGVSCSDHGRGDTSRRLEENKDDWHAQASGMEVANGKATCH